MQAQRKPCVWRFLLVRLAASLAALASELPAANVVHGVCNVLPVSLQLESARELNGCSGSSPPDSPQPTLRAFQDDPECIGELEDSLEFQEFLRYRLAKPVHINDSRVLLGFAQRADLAARLSHGFFGVPCPTRWKRSSARGPYDKCDVVCAAARVPKLASCWLKLLFLFCGDTKRNPGPNPRQPRGPLDLRSGYAPSTQYKTQKARRPCLHERVSTWGFRLPRLCVRLKLLP